MPGLKDIVDGKYHGHTQHDSEHESPGVSHALRRGNIAAFPGRLPVRAVEQWQWHANRDDGTCDGDAAPHTYPSAIADGLRSRLGGACQRAARNAGATGEFAVPDRAPTLQHALR